MIDFQWVVSTALGLLVIVLLVVAVFGVRWLRASKQAQELVSENAALSQVLFFAELFVANAQQQLKGIAGDDKLAWVTGALRELFPDLDEVTLRSAIEKAYLALPLDIRRELEPEPFVYPDMQPETETTYEEMTRLARNVTK